MKRESTRKLDDRALCRVGAMNDSHIFPVIVAIPFLSTVVGIGVELLEF
jgi:hypothetical protein